MEQSGSWVSCLCLISESLLLQSRRGPQYWHAERGSGGLTNREGVGPQLCAEDEASVNEVCTLLNQQAQEYLTCFIYALEVLYDTILFDICIFIVVGDAALHVELFLKLCLSPEEQAKQDSRAGLGKRTMSITSHYGTFKLVKCNE